VKLLGVRINKDNMETRVTRRTDTCSRNSVIHVACVEGPVLRMAQNGRVQVVKGDKISDLLVLLPHIARYNTRSRQYPMCNLSFIEHLKNSEALQVAA
jgi:hypothetical protein